MKLFMINIKKCMYVLTALCAMTVSFNMHGSRFASVTKKHIQNAQKAQVTKVVNKNRVLQQAWVAHSAKRNNRPLVRNNKNKGGHYFSQAADTTTLSKPELSVLSNNTKTEKTDNVTEQKQDNNTVALSNNNLIQPKNENVEQEAKNKEEDLIKKAQDQKEVNQNDKDQNNTVIQEAKQVQDEEAAFLNYLAALPADKLDDELAKLNINDQQKDEIKNVLKNLPKALHDLNDDLKDPASIGAQSLQGKGWLEYFRSDILNYSWVKTGVSWVRAAWDYTGGALLEKCGIGSKETIKNCTDWCFEGFYSFADILLSILGLNTPGAALDTVLMVALENYFPKENSWNNMIAKTFITMGYYGAIRGMPKNTVIWKAMEAFICVSYCKYFAKDNAGALRTSLLQKPINFFYYYIPNCVKDGWIEYLVSNYPDVKFYKSVTSLLGIGRMLAHVCMQNTPVTQPA